MYAEGLASNRHGIIAMPSNPVIKPPVLKEIRRGARFAKSFAGLTTLAAIFTANVAIPIPNSAITATSMRRAADVSRGASSPAGAVSETSFARMNCGSHSWVTSAPGRISWAALVTITPIAENDHGRRQPQRLAEHLLALPAPEAREVGDVEGQRRPETDHRGQRRREHGPELAQRRELRRRVEDGAQASGARHRPREQGSREHEHDGRRPVLEHAHRVHTVVDDPDVEDPEEREGDRARDAQAQDRRAAADRRETGPQRDEEGVDRLPADRALDAEPAARDDRPQHGGNVRAARPERRPREHGEGDAVARSRVRVEQDR